MSVSRDQVIGATLVLVSVIVIVIYGWLVFLTDWWVFLLKLTGFIAVLGIFGILAWIGYTLATTPPPKPIEEIEKELEGELKKLEKELKKNEGEEKPKGTEETKGSNEEKSEGGSS